MWNIFINLKNKRYPNSTCPFSVHLAHKKCSLLAPGPHQRLNSDWQPSNGQSPPKYRRQLLVPTDNLVGLGSWINTSLSPPLLFLSFRCHPYTRRRTMLRQWANQLLVTDIDGPFLFAVHSYLVVVVMGWNRPGMSVTHTLGLVDRYSMFTADGLSRNLWSFKVELLNPKCKAINRMLKKQWRGIIRWKRVTWKVVFLVLSDYHQLEINGYAILIADLQIEVYSVSILQEVTQEVLH